MKRQPIFYFVVTSIGARPASSSFGKLESQVRRIGKAKGYVRVMDPLPEKRAKHA